MESCNILPKANSEAQKLHVKSFSFPKKPPRLLPLVVFFEIFEKILFPPFQTFVMIDSRYASPLIGPGMHRLETKAIDGHNVSQGL